jgi:hypothetical protein
MNILLKCQVGIDPRTAPTEFDYIRLATFSLIFRILKSEIARNIAIKDEAVESGTRLTTFLTWREMMYVDDVQYIEQHFSRQHSSVYV